MAISKHSKVSIQRVPLIIIFLFLLAETEINEAQVTIPPNYDGFVYSFPEGPDFIFIEAFVDPVCPDSRDSWLPLKQLVHHYDYASSILLIVHPFPLPLVFQ